MSAPCQKEKKTGNLLVRQRLLIVRLKFVDPLEQFFPSLFWREVTVVPCLQLRENLGRKKKINSHLRLDKRQLTPTHPLTHLLLVVLLAPGDTPPFAQVFLKLDISRNWIAGLVNTDELLVVLG